MCGRRVYSTHNNNIINLDLLPVKGVRKLGFTFAKLNAQFLRKKSRILSFVALHFWAKKAAKITYITINKFSFVFFCAKFSPFFPPNFRIYLLIILKDVANHKEHLWLG